MSDDTYQVTERGDPRDRIANQQPYNAQAAEAQRTRQRMLDYIAGYQAEHGWAPTMREIGDAVGLSSPSSVHGHLKLLHDRGELVLGNGPRMIRLTQGTIELSRPQHIVEGHRVLADDGRLRPGR